MILETEPGTGPDDDGIVLPGGLAPRRTFDVAFNGRVVWSLVPARDTSESAGGCHVPWPTALRRHLVGRAEVELRDHRDGGVRGRWSHDFAGVSDRELTIADPAGRQLIVDKSGRLRLPMGVHEDDAVQELVATVEQILAVVCDRAGLPAFLAYGTLLGAVRQGGLIAHDNDLDVAYLSPRTEPVDIVRESYAVERALREAGWVVRRGSGARLNVRVRLSDGTPRAIDVFTAAFIDDVLYMPSDTGFALPRESLLPLSTVTLHGRELPAPARPDLLLAATYGSGWRTPDPSFRYETPRWLKRRLWGWYGGTSNYRQYWDGFYAHQHRRVPARPTRFATWVARHYSTARPLVDLGTGTGRDALWFARQHGRRVLALDYNLAVISRGARTARRRQLPVDFQALTLYDARAVLALGARLSRLEPHDLYARFLLHALDRAGQDQLFRLASMALRREGYLFLEFRTEADRDRPHAFAEHYCDYLRPADVAERIVRAGGTVVHVQEGTGLAPFEDEDPVVCRMVACWSDAARRAAPALDRREPARR